MSLVRLTAWDFATGLTDPLCHKLLWDLQTINENSFLLLLISNTIFRMNMLSAHDLDARNPLCSNPTISSLSTAADNLIKPINVFLLNLKILSLQQYLVFLHVDDPCNPSIIRWLQETGRNVCFLGPYTRLW